MGVDATGRAKHRKGELRLVLGLPEPWSDAQRDDFMKAVEGLTRDVGVAPGDVHIQAALLTTWNPSDELPPGVVTSADIQKLIIKFGSDQPRLQAEAYDKGYSLGREAGHGKGYALGLKHGMESAANNAQATEEAMRKLVLVDRVPPALRVPPPKFDLGPLSDDSANVPPWRGVRYEHTCNECGGTLDDCDRTGCGGAKPSGFRYGSASLATAADASLLPVEPADAATCDVSDCIIRHSTDTPHIWGMDEVDQLQLAGKLCDDRACADFHYLDDGSPHQHSKG